MDLSVLEGPPQMPIDLRALARRAQQYSRRCDRWMDGLTTRHAGGIDDPLVIVCRLAQVVPAEIQHALAGWLSADDETRELMVDPEQSAAIALVAIEHSRHAWLALIRNQHIRGIAAQPFISDLIWLKHEVERAFPQTCAPQ
jgi:hypothetical protein